jgi:hypothetical protein
MLRLPKAARALIIVLVTSAVTSPAAVRTALFNLTTKGIVTGSNSANNHLLFTNL